MKAFHALAAATATLLAASVPMSRPAEAGIGIQRCQDGDGTIVYTDKACRAHGASTMPMSAALMARIAHEQAMAEAHYDFTDTGQPVTPATARRSPAAGCARSPAQLAMDLRAAFALGDINRIAESFQWAGKRHRDGIRGMDRIDRLNDAPLREVQYLDATMGHVGMQVAGAGGSASAGIMQLWFGEGGTQPIIDLDVKRYQGCYFVEF